MVSVALFGVDGSKSFPSVAGGLLAAIGQHRSHTVQWLRQIDPCMMRTVKSPSEELLHCRNTAVNQQPHVNPFSEHSYSSASQ